MAHSATIPPGVSHSVLLGTASMSKYMVDGIEHHVHKYEKKQSTYERVAKTLDNNATNTKRNAADIRERELDL